MPTPVTITLTAQSGWDTIPTGGLNVAGFASDGGIGAIPGWGIGNNPNNEGGMQFAITLPNYPDTYGPYSINSTSITLDPTGTSSGNQPNAYGINVNVDPSNRGFAMTGGVDGLHIATTVGSTGGSSTAYGNVYATHVVTEHKSGSTANLGAHVVNVQVDSGATATNVYGLESTGSFASGANITNYTGVSIAPTGAATITGSIHGIQVDMSGLTGVSSGNLIAMELSTGKLKTNGNFTPASNAGASNYNEFDNTLHIASGSPISGTDCFTNVLGGQLSASDNFTTNGTNRYGLGFVGMTAGTQLGVATGKTVDNLVSNAAGIDISTDGGSLPSGGTLTNMTAVLAGIFSDTSSPGVLTVTNAYGFRVRNVASGFSLSSSATNAWGVSIEDAGCKNLFAGQVQLGNGSAATPAIAFSSDATTGMYTDGSGTLGLTASGHASVGITNNGSQANLNIGSGATGSTAFINFHSGSNSSNWPYLAANGSAGGTSLVMNCPLNTTTGNSGGGFYIQQNIKTSGVAYFGFTSALQGLGSDDTRAQVWLDNADLVLGPDNTYDIGLAGSTNIRPRKVAVGTAVIVPLVTMSTTGSTPANPPSGSITLFFDGTNLKFVNSSGTVKTITAV